MWASGLGWGLDAFDFYLYVYALPAIIVSLGISKSAGGLLATYTLIGSSLGGMLIGAFADRLGRKRMLMLSIVAYAVFTALCGLAQNYTQLAVFRVLEGVGLGGEWAVGSVLIAEWSRDDRRGRNLGFVQGAWALGWLAANIAFQIVFTFSQPSTSWRYLFFLGIVPALFALYIRRAVSDPPLFEASKSFTLPRIFDRRIIRTTLLASLLAVGAQTGYYALFTWMPAYLTTQRHLAPVTGGVYLYFLIAGCFAGYVTAGYINDAIGRRLTFVVFALCSAAIAPLYLYAVVANWQLLIAGPLLGYFASGIFSGFGPYLSELFPTDIRGAGQGFCYNAGRGIAGVAPFVIGALSERYPIGNAMTAVAIFAYLVATGAVLFLPETRRVALPMTL